MGPYLSYQKSIITVLAFVVFTPMECNLRLFYWKMVLWHGPVGNQSLHIHTLAAIGGSNTRLAGLAGHVYGPDAIHVACVTEATNN